MPQQDRHLDRITVRELEERVVAQGKRIRELEDREEKQRRELDRLKVAAKTSSAPAPEPVPDNGVPKGATVGPDGFVIRGGQRIGKMIAGKFEDYTASATSDDYQERQKQKTAQHNAAQDTFWAEATRGLPSGVWRAPDGLLRTRDGRVYSPAGNAALAEQASDFEKKSAQPGGFAYMQRQALRKD